jgi:hypothetical protein
LGIRLAKQGLTLCTLLSAFAPAAHALPLFSEDFESATGTFEVTAVSELSATTDYYSGPSVPGWTVNGGIFLADVAGDIALALNEFPVHGSATSPTISGFTIGEQYELSFFHFGDDQPNTTAYSFDVLLDATVISSSSRSYTSPGPGASEIILFTATATSHTLTFLDTTNVGQASGMIDDLEVNLVQVPEPHAFVLGLLGLAALRARRGA